MHVLAMIHGAVASTGICANAGAQIIKDPAWNPDHINHLPFEVYARRESPVHASAGSSSQTPSVNGCRGPFASFGRPQRVTPAPGPFFCVLF